MRTDRVIDRQPDMTKEVIGLRNSANSPKSERKAFLEAVDCRICSEQW